MSAIAGEHNSNWCWSSDTDAVQLMSSVSTIKSWKAEAGDADSAPFSSMVGVWGFSVDFHCNISLKSVLLTSHKPYQSQKAAASVP